MNRLARNSKLVCTLVALVLPAAQALAQAFPTKPVRITSMYSTGGTPDLTMRVVAEKLSRYWDKPVLVEPRPGGNGLVAVSAFKNASDVHEFLLLGGSMLSMVPAVEKNLPYDPINDFGPVSPIFKAPFVLVASSAGPYKSMQDLIAAARSSPSKVSYGTQQAGGPSHLGGAMLAVMTGTSMLAVHFKELSMLNTSMVNGDISFGVITLGSVMPMYRAGKLRVLAVAARSRMTSEPDIPTMVEAGGPAGYEIDVWTAFLAQKTMPRELLNRVSADVGRAMSEADVKERFRSLALDPAPATPDEMTSLIRTELARYAEVVKRAGISMQ